MVASILEDEARIGSELRGRRRDEYLAGAGKTSHLHVFAFLKPPDERTVTQDEIVTAVRRIYSAHPGNNPIVAVRSPLGGGESGTFPIQ